MRLPFGNDISKRVLQKAEDIRDLAGANLYKGNPTIPMQLLRDQWTVSLFNDEIGERMIS